MKKNIIFLAVLTSLTYGSSLKEVISHTLENNPQIKSLEKNTEANKYYIDEAIGDFLPTLNYEAYIEDKKSVTTPLNGETTKGNDNGYNQQLKLEQIIYNGGLREGKLKEQKHNYRAVQYGNILRIEDTIFQTTSAYLNYLKNQELILLQENNLEIHNSYLETALQTEEVSGDVIDRLTVENKIFNIQERLIDLKKDESDAKNLLRRYFINDIDGYICRPKILLEVIPENIDTILDSSVKTNYAILEEVENIKKQQAILSQEFSRYLPTIDVQLLKEIDDGIDRDDVKQDDESVRVSLSYNFFNGLKDYSINKREKLFLKESQENLDAVVEEVKQKLKDNFFQYNLSKEKISILKDNVSKIKEILAVYEEQFDGGTRSFIDILNQEEELFRKKSSLIEEEFLNYIVYFNLLFEKGILSDTINNINGDMCEEPQVDLRVRTESSENISDELESMLLGDELGLGSEEGSLFEDDGLESGESIPEEPEESIEDRVNQVFDTLIDKIYNKEDVETFDLNNQSINELNEVESKEIEEPLELPIEEEHKDKSKIKTESEIIIEDEMQSNAQENFENQMVDSIESMEPLETKPEETEEAIVDESLNTLFYDEDTFDGYTIVLKTEIDNVAYVKSFIASNNIENNSLIYRFKTNGNDYTRLMYGYYKSMDEAKLSFNELDEDLKSSGAYIDNISKNKKLYNKYKSFFWR